MGELQALVDDYLANSVAAASAQGLSDPRLAVSSAQQGTPTSDLWAV